jgi:hypothetical protein
MEIYKLYYLEVIFLYLIFAFIFLNLFKIKIKFFLIYQKTNIFIFLIFGFYLICRLPTIFAYDYLIGNPDETLYIAQAIKLKFFYFNFNKIDNSTSGILNSAILAWPLIFFQDVTIFTTRLTNVILIFLNIIITYRIFIILKIKKTLSLIYLVPIIFYFSFTDYHYAFTSNVFPVFLCLIGFKTLIKIHVERKASKKEIVLAGICLGLVPFAKLQAIPLGFFIYATIFVYLLSIKKIKQNIELIFFSLIPSFLIFFHLILINDFDSFYVNYILQSLAKQKIYNYPDLYLIIVYFISPKINQFLLAMLILSVLNLILIKKNFIKEIWILIIPIIGSLISIINAKTLTDHHMMYLTFFLHILIMVILNLNLEARKSNVSFFSFFKSLNFYQRSYKKLNKVKLKESMNLFYVTKICFVFFLIIFVLKSSMFSKYDLIKNQKVYFFSKIDQFSNGDLYNFGNFYQKLDSIYMWGWDGDVYIKSGLKPVGKRPSFEYEIFDQHIDKYGLLNKYKPNLTNYFISEISKDLNKEKPLFFVNANVEGKIGWDSLGWKNIKIPLQIKNFLANYIPINQKKFNCPEVMMREDKWSDIKKKIIKPINIKASNYIKNFEANKTDDFQFDNRCQSFWQFYFNRDKSIEYTFNKNEKIGYISILSTIHDKNIKKDIKLKIYNNDKVILLKEITINNYPKWTFVNFDLEKISKIKFELNKEMIGLTEVKFFSND